MKFVRLKKKSNELSLHFVCAKRGHSRKKSSSLLWKSGRRRGKRIRPWKEGRKEWRKKSQVGRWENIHRFTVFLLQSRDRCHPHARWSRRNWNSRPGAEPLPWLMPLLPQPPIESELNQHPSWRLPCSEKYLSIHSFPSYKLDKQRSQRWGLRRRSGTGPAIWTVDSG